MHCRYAVITQGIDGKVEGKGKGKVVPVHAMKANRGSRDIATLILNFGTRWR
jgi:hypothetical protein